jgi:hypothetical protein
MKRIGELVATAAVGFFVAAGIITLLICTWSIGHMARKGGES